MNRRHLDTLPSRRIARAVRAVGDWLRREDNDLIAFLLCVTAAAHALRLLHSCAGQ